MFLLSKFSMHCCQSKPFYHQKTTKLIVIYHRQIDTKTINLSVIYVEKFIGKNIISKDIWSFSIKLMTCMKLNRVSKKEWMQTLVSRLVKKRFMRPLYKKQRYRKAMLMLKKEILQYLSIKLENPLCKNYLKNNKTTCLLID